MARLETSGAIATLPEYVEALEQFEDECASVAVVAFR
jgi:hypothetical protein